MLPRAMLVAAAAAVAFPLLGGTSHASCLDDALARDLAEGYSDSPKSEHWDWLFVPSYVQHSGTATVTVHGDALVADYTSYVTDDTPEWTQVVAANAVDTVTDFADCVAG